MKNHKDTTHPIVYWAIGIAIAMGFTILAWLHFTEGL